MKKSDASWRKLLTPEQYHICRKGGTEPPFSGEHYPRKEPGIYLCVCCKNPLFNAESKFDSGSGWPSYTHPVADNAVTILKDKSHGMVRNEVRCSNCDAHLGHVFPDGPHPGTLRYCINSTSLQFKKTPP